MKTRMRSKDNQLAFTIEALTALKERNPSDDAEWEWVRNALQLDRLTEKQLRAIEFMANKNQAGR